MPKIEINELRLAGAAFFSESENFLNELTDETVLTQVNGGLFTLPITVTELPPTYGNCILYETP